MQYDIGRRRSVNSTIESIRLETDVFQANVIEYEAKRRQKRIKGVEGSVTLDNEGTDKSNAQTKRTTIYCSCPADTLAYPQKVG